jgi:hypothetical protein
MASTCTVAVPPPDGGGVGVGGVRVGFVASPQPPCGANAQCGMVGPSHRPTPLTTRNVQKA